MILTLIVIHKFFIDQERKITDAFNMAGDLITAIVDSIDRKEGKKNNVALGIALLVLSAGLFLIPAVGPIAGISTAGIAAANARLAALNVQCQHWHKVCFLTVEEPIPNRMRPIVPALVKGLGQQNVSTFLAFAGEGNFPNSERLSVPDVRGTFVSDLPRDRIQPILQAYNTFIASTMLAETGWHAILLPGVNPKGITNKSARYPAWAGEDRNKDDIHCTESNEFNQCSGMYARITTAPMY
ncbi:MAG: hypothetical protein Q9209_007773 [Squamulea sp. 1 TL-2023]